MVPKITHSTQGEAAQSSAEQDNHSPQLASRAVLDAPQATAAVPGYPGTLLAPVQFAVKQCPQISCAGAATQHLISVILNSFGICAVLHKKKRQKIP